MKKSTHDQIKQLVKKKILEKIKKYDPESKSKPFFEATFNRKAIRQAALMQSLYTSFGMSLYEQIAVLLARDAGYYAERQYKLLGSINNETRLLIDHICEKPISTEGSKNDEIEKVRQTSTLGEALEIPDSTVDVFIKDNKDIEHYIDITTVKLNKKGARSLRRKMLVWAALRFSQNPNAQVKTYLGLPYNPYNPKPYYRSFVVGNCHIDEVLVQDDFWGLCAGYDVFDELIAIFKEVGIEIEDDLADFIDGV